MQGFKDFYFAPLRLIAAMARRFSINRQHLAAFVARQRVSALLKAVSIATLLAWLIIWALRHDEPNNRLDQAIGDLLPDKNVARDAPTE